MTAPYIHVDGVNIRFPVSLSGSQQSALGALAKTVSGGLVGSKAASVTYVTALRNISLSLKAGDRLGLIGSNGAGKSTMLRLLGGTLPPTDGTIDIQGSSTNLLHLGAGMDSEQSGLENIKRMCRLLSIPKEKWAGIEEDVRNFADLGAFLAVPMRTYSAGMGLRLAFAMATAHPRDILIIDEIIGAGDAAFFDKARARMDAFIENASILVMASHSEGVIKDMCNRALYIERGEILADGEPDAVWRIYMQRIGK